MASCEKVERVAIELELTEHEASLILAVLNEVRLTGAGRIATGIIDALEGEGVEVSADDFSVKWDDGALALAVDWA